MKEGARSVYRYILVRMIEQITQKEYRQLAHKKELMPGKTLGYLIFLGKDGNYYKTDHGGIVGGREMYEWQQGIKERLDSQTTLL